MAIIVIIMSITTVTIITNTTTITMITPILTTITINMWQAATRYRRRDGGGKTKGGMSAITQTTSALVKVNNVFDWFIGVSLFS